MTIRLSTATLAKMIDGTQPIISDGVKMETVYITYGLPACSLFRYRFGKNPARKQPPLTDEQKQAVRERFKKSTETENSPRYKGEI